MDDIACPSAATCHPDAVADPHKSVILPSLAETRTVMIAATYGLDADRSGVNFGAGRRSLPVGNVAAQLRHAELVSASMDRTADNSAAPWTLNRVQGDEK